VPKVTPALANMATQPPVLSQSPTPRSTTNEIYNISVSPDGKLLALSASFGVQVYRLGDGQLVFFSKSDLWNPFQGIYSYIAWSPDGSALAVGKPNVGVRVWDAMDWKPLAEKVQNRRSRSEFPGFAWSPDGEHLALGMGGNEIAIWDKKSHAWETKTVPLDAEVSLTWNSKNQLLVMDDITLYDVNSKKVLKKLDTIMDGGYAYAVWSPDETHVFTFFDLGGGILNFQTNIYDKFASCCYSEIAWSMDGRYFAATPEGSNEISIWDTMAEQVIAKKAQGDLIYAFSWLPDDELLAAGSLNGKEVLWNTNTGNIVLEITH
jgi:WD40 repeat protein